MDGGALPAGAGAMLGALTASAHGDTEQKAGVSETPRPAADEALQVNGLSVVDAEGTTRLNNFTLIVNRGEIVGVAGVEGNGQSELAAALSGMTLIAEPARFDLYGTPTLLMHGDTLCTDDTAYQAFRRRARHPLTLALLRRLPYSLRQRLARQARAGSESAKAGKAAAIMDVNMEEVVRVLREQQVSRLIHGHTHRPAKHVHAVDGRDCERWVLPDWYVRWGYVVCDAAGCALRVEAL